MVYRLLTTLGLLAAAAPAAAEQVQLSSEAIRTTFAGSLVNMNTPAGTIIPVRFGTDGLVSGEAGVLGPVLGAQRDRGRWWAERDQLCMKWFRWFEAEKRCVTVHMEGELLYWRGEDRSGTATIVERQEVVVAATRKPASKPPVEEPAPRATPERAAPTQAAPAQAAPAHAEKAAIATLADTAPTFPAVEAPQPHTTPHNDRAERLALRFAAASLGPMSFAAPLHEPGKLQHLLDAPERAAIGAKAAEEQATVAAQAAPDPKAKVTPPQADAAKADAAKTDGAVIARAQDPSRKPRDVAARAYASSTMVLASFRVAGVDADDMLNVRSGPAIFYPSVGSLLPEERGVKVVGPCRADWCPIQRGRIAGWVNRNFLTEETTDPGTAAVTR